MASYKASKDKLEGRNASLLDKSTPLSDADLPISPARNSKKMTFVHSHECHDFKWSRALWANAAARILHVTVGLFIVYIGLAILVSYADGLRGVDIFYLYSSIITTVGLGDLSPQGKLHRGASIFLIPFGLILCSMGISAIEARAKSLHIVVKTESRSSIPQSLLIILFKYCCVVLVGSVFFLFHKREIRLQNDNGVEMTFVDAVFFATVVSSTVGYGHMITPQTVAAKCWMIFYFIFSSAAVASLINKLARLYLRHKENQIEDTIIDSTTWVHKADLLKCGVINESAYVMFKLQQLQKVDEEIKVRLAYRFDEIDIYENGVLDIGFEVPSGEQVKLMKNQGATDLIGAWREMSDQIVVESGLQKEATAAIAKHGLRSLTGGSTPLRLSTCHDFSWSRSLWKIAVKQIVAFFLGLVIVWCILGYFVLASEFDGVVSWYFLSATLSTTGFGDFAPTTQSTRAVACFMVPFGLVIISLGMSLAYAHTMTKLVVPKRDMALAIEKESEFQFKALLSIVKGESADKEFSKYNDDRLTKTEVMEAHAKLGVTKEEAGILFDARDSEGKGYLSYKKPALPWNETISARVAFLLVKIYTTILVGAIFIKLFPAENKALGLSWLDAVYYGTVIATSVGFGDVNVQTSGGRIFLTVYMVVATVFLASRLAEFIDLYVNAYVGEGIVRKLIDSTTWVHKADVRGTGFLNEADYVLFKLQQMQKVDNRTLRRLVSKFSELEGVHSSGRSEGRGLEIGVDIPDATQVQQMRRYIESEGLSITLNDCWKLTKCIKNDSIPPLATSAPRKNAPRSMQQSLPRATSNESIGSNESFSSDSKQIKGPRRSREVGYV
mmetsp:Transcript_168/g.373  ORF Transcript_168/g.373 Transcript_168/m.373 type:complete len:840 (+) Transcript_168:136-2655(+)